MPPEFTRWLHNILAPEGHSPDFIPAEDYHRWAEAVCDPARRPASADERKALAKVFADRSGLPAPLTDADLVIAILTEQAFAAKDVVPPAFKKDYRVNDLMDGLKAALNRLVSAAKGKDETAASHARLVWLLRAVGPFRAGVEPILSDEARAALGAVAALTEGALSATPEAGDTKFVAYLRAQAGRTAPPPPPRRRAGETLLQFVGGDRFGWTATGAARLAVLAVLAVVAAAAGIFYAGAGSRVEDFRTRNQLPAYEKSLIGR